MACQSLERRRGGATGAGLLPWLALVAGLAGSCSFKPSGTPAPVAGGGGNGGLAVDGGTATTGGGNLPGVTSLQLSPAMASIAVTNSAPVATQQYTVTGTVGGHSEDLTSMVAYSASPPGIVTVDNTGLATATGTAGGRVTITASAGSVSAQATLMVTYSFTGADPGAAGTGVPANAQAIFSGAPADPSRAPKLVYPNDGVLFPPNVSGIEVHFTPGKNNTLFEVSLAGPLSTVTTFVRCTAPNGIKGCIYLPGSLALGFRRPGERRPGAGHRKGDRNRRHRNGGRDQFAHHDAVCTGRHPGGPLLLDDERTKRDRAVGFRGWLGGDGLPDTDEH